jgi:RNA polymerase sigma factor (sigma-70 family)
MTRRTSTIRVLIAEDHPIMRSALRDLLRSQPDMSVVAEAKNGREAIELFRERSPDLCLIDLQMPQTSGLDAIAAIRKSAPSLPIVVLTTFSGDARVARALSVGATAYLLKTASGHEVVNAIRCASAGRTVLDPAVLREIEACQALENLSPRELDVLPLVASGETNRDIGKILNVSEQTVKTRIKNVLKKLAAQNRAHAITLAVRRGFIDL